MIYIFVFYWIVSGLVTISLPSPNNLEKTHPITNLILSMLFGGLVVPARLLVKLLR